MFIFPFFLLLWHLRDLQLTIRNFAALYLLASEIRSSHVITHLGLDFCELTEVAMQPLAEAILSNISLRSVKLPQFSEMCLCKASMTKHSTLAIYRIQANMKKAILTAANTAIEYRIGLILVVRKYLRNIYGRVLTACILEFVIGLGPAVHRYVCDE